MKFGPVPVDAAAGAILAHSIRHSGGVLKKGRVLSTADADLLRTEGLGQVTAAKLEPGDLHEDAAAALIATAATGDGIRAGAAFTGRANLIAGPAGVALIDESRVAAINGVDEAITVATVAPFAIVRPRQIVATVKIIPFAVEGGAARAAASYAARGEPLVRVAPFRDSAVGLVQTVSTSTRDTILDKTAQTVRDRVESYGAHLAAEIRCAHEEKAVARAVSEHAGNGCRPILVIGASAIVDRRDVIPAAIERAGGTLERFGMPVDPGNLLLLARLGEISVVGAPGCARSPKFNGFDHVLARLLAGVPVTPADIAALGSGGLLSDAGVRPHPRETPSEPRAAPRVGAVVLAAGLSRRAGGTNKLLATFGGTAMVTRTVDAVLAAPVRPVVVVLGHQESAVRAALAGREVTFTYNPRYTDGLSTSLRQGLDALRVADPAADGVLVCLGDMPLVRAAHMERLVSAFSPEDARAVCVPTHCGSQGNPVLWGRQFFDEIGGLSGDTGARQLIRAHPDSVAEVAMDDDAVLMDVDTRDGLAALGATPAEPN